MSGGRASAPGQPITTITTCHTTMLYHPEAAPPAPSTSVPCWVLVRYPSPWLYEMPVDGISSWMFFRTLKGFVQLVAGTAQGFCDSRLIRSCCSILCNPKTVSGKRHKYLLSCFTSPRG